MKTLSLSRETLNAALATVKPIVPKRLHIPILACVQLRKGANGADLVATDLDVEITAHLSGADIEDGFSATLPHSTLADMVKKAPKGADVKIEATGKSEAARVCVGALRANVEAHLSTDFPAAEFKAPIKAQFELNARAFGEALKDCELAISTEETRYYLNGVYMHPIKTTDGRSALRLVATDGHRLARFEFLADCGQDWQGVIVPSATVAILIKQCLAKGAPEWISVKVNTQKVLFTVDNVEILSKLIDGTFPDYGRVIPHKLDKVATFNRLDMIGALNSVRSICSEGGRAVALHFEQYKVKLVCHNPDTGASSIDLACEYNDVPFVIGFDSSYLLEIVAACHSNTLQIAMQDAGRPAAIRHHAGSDNFYVLMPMRVSTETPEQRAAAKKAAAEQAEKAKADAAEKKLLDRLSQAERDADARRMATKRDPRVIGLAAILARVAPHLRAELVSRFDIGSGADRTIAPIHCAFTLAAWLVENGATPNPERASALASTDAKAETSTPIAPADKGEMKSACVASWGKDEAPASPAPASRVRFFYNGLKTMDHRKLQKAFYSLQNHDGGNYPRGTVTVYGRNYSRFTADVRNAFTVKNDTDSQTDYFEQDRFNVPPSHPFYSLVLAGYEAQQAYRGRTDARRAAKRKGAA